jgi:hypothetical protein
MGSSLGSPTTQDVSDLWAGMLLGGKCYGIKLKNNVYRNYGEYPGNFIQKLFFIRFSRLMKCYIQSHTITDITVRLFIHTNHPVPTAMVIG